MSTQYKVLVGNILTGSERVSHLIKDSKFDKCIRFINASDKNLWMCSPDGSIVHLKPSIEYPERNSLIIVYDNYPFDNDVAWIEGYEDSNLKKISLAAKQNGRVEYEEEVSVDEILKYPAGVYLTKSDVVVTENFLTAKAFHHPKCLQKIHNDYISATTEINADDVISVAVRLIDNIGLTPSYYTVFHNTVQRLNPIADANQRDGIYVTGLVELRPDGSRTTRMDNYYSFEDVAKGNSPINIFNTYREASDARDSYSIKAIEYQDKVEAREHEKTLATMKREFDERILKMEKENKERDFELKGKDAILNELKAIRENDYHAVKHTRSIESERLSMDSNEHKYRYERASNDNKVFTETIKTLGLLAAGAVAMKTLFG